MPASDYAPNATRDFPKGLPAAKAKLDDFFRQHNVSGLVDLLYRLNNASAKPLVFPSVLASRIHLINLHRRELCIYFRPVGRSRSLDLTFAFPPRPQESNGPSGVVYGDPMGTATGDAAQPRSYPAALDSFTLEEAGGTVLGSVARPLVASPNTDHPAHPDAVNPDWRYTRHYEFVLALKSLRQLSTKHRACAEGKDGVPSYGDRHCRVKKSLSTDKCACVGLDEVVHVLQEGAPRTAKPLCDAFVGDECFKSAFEASSSKSEADFAAAFAAAEVFDEACPDRPYFCDADAYDLVDQHTTQVRTTAKSTVRLGSGRRFEFGKAFVSDAIFDFYQPMSLAALRRETPEGDSNPFDGRFWHFVQATVSLSPRREHSRLWQRLTVDLTGLFSLLGGNMGLLLGASLFSILQILILIPKIARAALCSSK